MNDDAETDEAEPSEAEDKPPTFATLACEKCAEDTLQSRPWRGSIYSCTECGTEHERAAVRNHLQPRAQDPIGDKPRNWSEVVIIVDSLRLYMLKKLRFNNHKAHWSVVHQMELLGRLREEVDEIEDAIKNGSPEDVRDECGDVGAIAAMIADNARREQDGS